MKYRSLREGRTLTDNVAGGLTRRIREDRPLAALRHSASHLGRLFPNELGKVTGGAGIAWRVVVVFG